MTKKNKLQRTSPSMVLRVPIDKDGLPPATPEGRALAAEAMAHYLNAFQRAVNEQTKHDFGVAEHGSCVLTFPDGARIMFDFTDMRATGGKQVTLTLAGAVESITYETLEQDVTAPPLDVWVARARKKDVESEEYCLGCGKATATSDCGCPAGTGWRTKTQ